MLAGFANIYHVRGNLGSDHQVMVVLQHAIKFVAVVRHNRGSVVNLAQILRLDSNLRLLGKVRRIAGIGSHSLRRVGRVCADLFARFVRPVNEVVARFRRRRGTYGVAAIFHRFRCVGHTTTLDSLVGHRILQFGQRNSDSRTTGYVIQRPITGSIRSNAKLRFPSAIAADRGAAFVRLDAGHLIPNRNVTHIQLNISTVQLIIGKINLKDITVRCRLEIRRTTQV